MLNTTSVMIICVTILLIVISVAVAVCVHTQIECGSNRKYVELKNDVYRVSTLCEGVFAEHADIKREIKALKKHFK